MKKNSHFSSEKKTYPPRQTPPPQSNNLTAETLMLAKIKPFWGACFGPSLNLFSHFLILQEKKLNPIVAILQL